MKVGVNEMKYLILVLLAAFSTFANDLAVPKVAHIENNYHPCLTDNGRTIAFLNGNSFAPIINLISTQDWSVKSIPSPILSSSQKLECGTNSLVLLSGEFIRKLDTNTATQIDATTAVNKINYLTDHNVIGNTLIEAKNNSVRATSLDKLTSYKDIELERTHSSDFQEYSDKYIYIRHMNFQNRSGDDYRLIDIPSGKTKDISSELKECTYAKLTSVGDYLHAACFNNSEQEARVFNTETLERNNALEAYLNKFNQQGYDAKTVKFFDQYKNFLLIAFNETLIIWDLDTNKVKNSYKSSCFITEYAHQNGKVLMSCGKEAPYTLIDIDNGRTSKQPFAYNKPLSLYVEHNAPKAVLKTGDTSIGIWNIFEHRWEQRLDNNPMFKRNAYSQDKIKPIISGKNIFIASGYREGKDPIGQYSLENGRLLFSYRADSSGNYPQDMAVSDSHHKLIVHYQNTPKCDGFKIYDTLNGKLLYDLKATQRHMNVNSMKLSEDGNALIVTTKKSNGYVNMEEEGSYKYDNQPSIMTFDLKTEKVTVQANIEKYDKPTDVVKGNNFNLSWDEEHKAVAISKDDSSNRKFYLYMPFGTSEWIDIDNLGNFDSSKLGLEYVYICDKLRCKNIDQAAKKHFYNAHALKKFISE